MIEVEDLAKTFGEGDDAVESSGRLVEEEDPRPVNQCSGKVESPPHTARVGPDPSTCRVLEADQLEQLIPANGRGRPVEAVEPRV